MAARLRPRTLAPVMALLHAAYHVSHDDKYVDASQRLAEIAQERLFEPGVVFPYATDRRDKFPYYASISYADSLMLEFLQLALILQGREDTSRCVVAQVANPPLSASRSAGESLRCRSTRPGRRLTQGPPSSSHYWTTTSYQTVSYSGPNTSFTPPSVFSTGNSFFLLPPGSNAKHGALPGWPAERPPPLCPRHKRGLAPRTRERDLRVGDLLDGHALVLRKPGRSQENTGRSGRLAESRPVT